jgi:hypothetical protein
MPNFKCVACRTRTRRAGDAADFIGDLCPLCGSPHELVSELGEVVGFRSVTTAAPSVDHAAPLGDFAARRNAFYAQRVRDALDARQWGDEGVSAVLAVALPTSDERLLAAGKAPGEEATR